jgi:hypothetical protein
MALVMAEAYLVPAYSIARACPPGRWKAFRNGRALLFTEAEVLHALGWPDCTVIVQPRYRDRLPGWLARLGSYTPGPRARVSWPDGPVFTPADYADPAALVAAVQQALAPVPAAPEAPAEAPAEFPRDPRGRWAPRPRAAG